MILNKNFIVHHAGCFIANTSSPRSTTTWSSSTEQPRQHAVVATSSTKMDACSLTVLLQGDMTSMTVLTTSDVEQLHRHTDITIVMASTTAHMVLARPLCAWWVPPVLAKLVILPTTASSDIHKMPRRYLSRCKTSSIAAPSYILRNFLCIWRSWLQRLRWVLHRQWLPRLRLLHHRLQLQSIASTLSLASMTLLLWMREGREERTERHQKGT
jgi:hypothetical protein